MTVGRERGKSDAEVYESENGGGDSVLVMVGVRWLVIWWGISLPDCQGNARLSRERKKTYDLELFRDLEEWLDPIPNLVS